MTGFPAASLPSIQGMAAWARASAQLPCFRLQAFPLVPGLIPSDPPPILTLLETEEEVVAVELILSVVVVVVALEEDSCKTKQT
jgi:hypothetical protein